MVETLTKISISFFHSLKSTVGGCKLIESTLLFKLVVRCLVFLLRSRFESFVGCHCIDIFFLWGRRPEALVVVTHRHNSSTQDFQNSMLWGSVVRWLTRRTRDSVADSIPTTPHIVIALGKQFTYISSVHPSVK